MKRVMMFAAMVIVPLMLFSQKSFCQNTQTSSNKSDTSISFPQKAYSSGMMEIKLGRLAQQNASSDKVKQFGERMITDHSKANKELEDIARKNNISLPDKMFDENQDAYNELSKYKGAEFDKNYINKMVKDHKSAISDFEKAKENADNTDVRQWAQNTLPTLKQHLELEQQTQKTLNKGKQNNQSK